MDPDLLFRRISMTIAVLVVALVAACETPAGSVKRDASAAPAATSAPSGY